jgi:hypothetical protein
MLNLRGTSALDKQTFGEFALYAVYALDVSHESISVRISQGTFLRQIHRERVLREFHFDSYIAHFVDKGFDVSFITEHLSQLEAELNV